MLVPYIAVLICLNQSEPRGAKNTFTQTGCECKRNYNIFRRGLGCGTSDDDWTNLGSDLITQCFCRFHLFIALFECKH